MLVRYFIKSSFEFIKALFWTAAAGSVLVLLCRILIILLAESRILPLNKIQPMQTAIVFGAGLRRDGSPTAVLRDRVETSADLYFSGIVKTILMSGDQRNFGYNEATAMKSYAISLGVPEKAILVDPAGRSTYETCLRAAGMFNIKQAVLVTQKFHLPRALYTCQALGMDTVGAAADRRNYTRISQFYWNLRELPATVKALMDVHLSHPRTNQELEVRSDPIRALRKEYNGQE